MLQNVIFGYNDTLRSKHSFMNNIRDNTKRISPPLNIKAVS